MSIADKLQTLQTIKTDIKTSILNKGVEVTDDFSTYADAIDNITTGGGETITLTDIEITRNGMYTASDGEGYKNVNVNVPTGSSDSFATSAAKGEISQMDMVKYYLNNYEGGNNEYIELFIDNYLLYKYDGYIVRSPNTNELGIENYTFDTNSFVWKYIQNSFEQQQITETNPLVESYLDENWENYNNYNNINGSLVTNCYKLDADIPIFFVDDYSRQEYKHIVYDDYTEYSIYNYNKGFPQDKVTYNEITSIKHKIVPNGQFFTDNQYFIQNIEQQNFKSGLIILRDGESLNCVCTDEPIKVSDWLLLYPNREPTIDIYTGSGWRFKWDAPLKFNINKIEGPYGFRFESDYIKEIHIKEIDLPNISEEMFANCKGVTTITIDKITSYKPQSFYNWFAYCGNLETINNIDMSCCSNCTYMFGECYSLTNVGGLYNLGLSFRQNNQYLTLYSPKLTITSIMNIFNTIYDMNLRNDNINSAIMYIGENVHKLSAEQVAIATAKGWTITA